MSPSSFTITRIAGPNRFATAAMIAERSFPRGADTVVIVNGATGHFADALTGNFLAGLQPGGAPILLTTASGIPAPVERALSRLSPKRAFLVGGLGALNRRVADALTKRGMAVTRLAGQDRYDTMSAVALEPGNAVGSVHGKRTAIVATGTNFPDALAAGPIAYASHFPVVLVKPHRLPAEAKRVLHRLRIQQVIIAGGTGAVSVAVEKALHRGGATTLFRAAGADRADTSVKLADWAIRSLGYSDARLNLASGAARVGGADALAAGPHAGQEGPATLVISDDAQRAGSVTKFVAEHATTLRSGHVFGGAAAVSDAVAAAIRAAGGGGSAGGGGGSAGGGTSGNAGGGSGGSTGGSSGSGVTKVVAKQGTVIEPVSAVKSVTGDSTGTQTTVLADGAKLPAVGGVLVAPLSPTAPNGLVGTVSSVTHNADGTTTVTTTPATLDEAFSTFDLSFDTSLADALTVPAPSPAPTGARFAMRRAAVNQPVLQGAAKFDATTALFDCTTQGGYSFNVGVDLSDTEFTGYLDIYRPSLTLGVSSHPVFSLDYQLDGSADCHLREGAGFHLEVPIPNPGGVPLFLTISPVLELSADGTIDVKFEWKPRFAFDVSIGNTGTNPAYSFGSSTDFKVTGEAHAEAYLAADIGVTLAGRAGIDGSLGPDLALDASFEGANACLSATGAIRMDLHATLDVFVKHWSATLASGEFAKKDLYHACTPAPLTLITASLPSGSTAVPYTGKLSAGGGAPPYRWSATGLPAGLTLDPSSGAITGTPTVPGAATVGITLTDSEGHVVAKSFTLNVSKDSLVIDTDGLLAATAGTPYSQQLLARGGSGSYTWSLTDGALPAGLSLSSGGDISGTPRSVGTSSFTVKVTDQDNDSATQELSLTVSAKLPALSGTVTDVDTGDPISGVTVTVRPGGASATTAADGTYLLQDLPESTTNVTVEFTPPDGSGYVGQWYDDQPDQTHADQVALSTSHVVTKVDAHLQRGHAIQGVVTSAATGDPVAGVVVTAEPSGDSTTTASDGTYLLTGLPLNKQTVHFGPRSDQPFADQWYDDETDSTSAASITISAEQIISGIDAALQPGGSITGTVTGPAGSPAANVHVLGCPATQHTCSAESAPLFAHSAETDADGTYTLTNLPVDGVKVHFAPSSASNLVAQWYQNAPDQASAKPVAVTADTTVLGIDAQLAQGGQISGSVTDSNGTAVAGVEVDPHSYLATSGEVIAPVAFTDADGHYTLHGVPAGPAVIVFLPPGPTGLAAQAYQDHRSAANADAVQLSAGQALTAIDATLAPGGGISGTVTGPQGQPVAHELVSVFDSAGDPLPESAQTAADGSYAISGLPVGDVTVKFHGGDGSFATQWYDGRTSSTGADPVTIAAGGTTANIDAVLTASGQSTISGEVSDPAGAPVAGVRVEAYVVTGSGGPGPASGAERASATTDSGGAYQLSVPAPGTYAVRFVPASSTSFATQWYSGADSGEQATPVTVSSDAAATDVSAQLAYGGSVSGTVTDTDQKVLGDVVVTAYPAAGSTPLEGRTVPLSSTRTEADGSYVLSNLPAGDVKLYFTPAPGFFLLSRWSGNATTFAAAASTRIQVGVQSGPLDAQLPYGGTVSGKVTDTSGNALAGIRVSTLDGDIAVTTGSDGTYTLSAVPVGTHSVGYYAPDQSPYLSDTKSGVSVTKGQTTNADVMLSDAGFISGTVTGSDNQGVANVLVSVSSASTSQTGYTSTKADGSYAVKAPVGSDLVEFDPQAGSGLMREWYQDAFDQADATPVAVAFGDTTSGIDQTVQQAATVTGTVTGPGGNPMGGVDVTVYTADGQQRGLGSASTDDAGVYSVSDLPAGLVTVRFTPPTGSGLVEQWYAAEPDYQSADPVATTAGQTTANIDASLVKGATVTGTVTGPDGNPVGGVDVTVYTADGHQEFLGSATTDDTGAYSVPDLPAGQVAVRFTPPGGSGLVEQWYADELGYLSADRVATTAGQTTANIDASLAEGATVTGTVTGPDGNPVGGVDVTVYTADGHQEFLASATTDDAGVYSVAGLPAGVVTVRFTPPGGSGLVEQWYADEPDYQSADQVQTTAGQTTANINATLMQGGAITGTVTGPDGKAVAGVFVCPEHPDGSSARCSSTDTDGTYTLSGLSAGSYLVDFEPPDGSDLVRQWYQGQIDPSLAEPVSVTVGQTTKGIDAKLAQGGAISGTVTGADGKPVAGTTVCPIPLDYSSWMSCANTDADGAYALSGLSAGSYQIDFLPPAGSDFVEQWYKDATGPASADPVSVTTGQTTKGIDATLVQGGALAGTVTDPGGNGVAGASVCAYLPDGSVSSGCADTNTDGTYTLTGLSTGTYQVAFYPPDGSGLAGEWYDNEADSTSADPVSVTAGQTTKGIDASLAQGGAITGTVTGPDGPVVGAFVCPSLSDGSPGGTCATTSTDGTYTLSGLAAGTVLIDFIPPDGSGLAEEWYDNAAGPASADPVSVTAGQTTTGIDAALLASG